MTAPYCVIGCTRGTGLQIARQLAERGVPVLGVARDPVKARGLLPAAAEIRPGDVTDPDFAPSPAVRRVSGDLLRGGHHRRSCRSWLLQAGKRDPHGDISGPGECRRRRQGGGVHRPICLVSGMGSELPSFTGRLLNAIKGDLQRNQRDRDAYLRNSGLDWSIGRGGILTDESGGRADIVITPPIHRLSLFRRVARADLARALVAAADAPAASARTFDVFNEPDLARALVAAADAPAASARTFDVFNEPGVPPTDTELAERLQQLSKSS